MKFLPLLSSHCRHLTPHNQGSFPRLNGKGDEQYIFKLFVYLPDLR